VQVRLVVELNLLLLLASLCAAQGTGRSGAELRKLRIVRNGDQVRLELTLSNPVVPSLSVLTNPDRLVIDLPNTTANPGQRHIAVNLNGVLAVRVGLKSSNPLITRTVVDLNAVHRCELSSAGKTIVLMVLPATTTSSAMMHSRGAAPAANGLLIGKLLAGQQDASGARSTTVKFSRSAVVDNGANAETNKSTPLQSTDEKLRLSFKVKYVAEGAAYLSGGRSSGLAEGMKLVVRDAGPRSAGSTGPQGPVVAELQIVSVAETSAVTEIRNPTRDLKPGDWADLSTEDSANLGAQRSVSVAANNPSPVLPSAKPTTTEQPPAPLQGESRIRARIGFDYSGISSSGSTPGRSSTVGMALQTDMTQIAGTHWNLQGYWRGRLTNNSQPNEDTLQDYLDRTYTIQLYYDNPNSKWVAGFGRLYLPWAVSLDTIDGGYVGRKVAHGVLAGVFLGSTPDPTSWHYSPDQQIGGSFVNFEGGSWDDLHYTSTTGVALSLLKWQLDRPYVFFENGLSYRKYVSVYHSLIVDSPQGISTDGIKPGTGISRSYLSLLIQPNRRISFDISHNYFRDVPTAATALIGTGLVDKLLYQGVNAGVRVELVRHFTVYTTLGRSDKTGDAKRSLNQMYGATWSEIWRTGLRADFHYSKFDSSFAQGSYQVLSLSRHLGNRMNWDAQVGRQTLDSTFTVNHRSLFLDTSFDANLGSHTYLQSGYTIERGAQLNYNQWYLSLGYRLNVKGPVK
jgi:AMIN domain